MGEEREGEGIRREGRGGNPKVGSHPRNPEKYPERKTDLIGWGCDTDLCPMR